MFLWLIPVAMVTIQFVYPPYPASVPPGDGCPHWFLRPDTTSSAGEPLIHVPYGLLRNLWTWARSGTAHSVCLHLVFRTKYHWLLLSEAIPLISQSALYSRPFSCKHLALSSFLVFRSLTLFTFLWLLLSVYTWECVCLLPCCAFFNELPGMLFPHFCVFGLATWLAGSYFPDQASNLTHSSESPSLNHCIIRISSPPFSVEIFN